MGEQRSGARRPVSLTRDGKPLPLSGDPRRHRLSACTHIPTRFIHAEALPRPPTAKPTRHRIRADLERPADRAALNACAAPPPNAPFGARRRS
ncbi:hypothetical protein M8494_35770 [Serratia ureilytica]